VWLCRTADNVELPSGPAFSGVHLALAGPTFNGVRISAGQIQAVSLFQLSAVLFLPLNSSSNTPRTYSDCFLPAFTVIIAEASFLKRNPFYPGSESCSL
jgi:hypothetical protein